MTPKTPRSATLADLLAQPEGVWHEAPKGLDVTFVYGASKGDRRRVVVPLSKAASKQLRAWDGKKLSAKVERGMLVIERIPSRPAKKARRA